MTRLAGLFVKMAIGAFCLMAFGGAAMAQTCNVSIDQMSFGIVRLVDLATSGTPSTVTADCIGQANETIRLCPSLQGGEIANTGTPGARLQVKFYSDVNYQIPWQSGIDIVLDGAGTGHATMTLYGRLSQASWTKPGVHNGVINLALAGNYVSTGPICGAGGQGIKSAVVSKPVATSKTVAVKR